MAVETDFLYSLKEDVGDLLLHINYSGRTVGALLNTYSMRCFHAATTQVVICLGNFAVGLGEFPDGFILSVDDEDIGVQTAFRLFNHDFIHRFGNVDGRLLQETVVGSRFHVNATFHLKGQFYLQVAAVCRGVNGHDNEGVAFDIG